MASDQPAAVALVAVDEKILDHLVAAATTDAAADEVTPPLTAGPAWTPERVAWLREFHRTRRAGLAGPTGEATWAVRVAGNVIGSVRLMRTDEPDVLETGIWLTRHTRGHGVGRSALSAVLGQAAGAGAVTVRAETSADNVAALAILQALGGTLDHGADSSRVRAIIELRSTPRIDPPRP